MTSQSQSRDIKSQSLAQETKVGLLLIYYNIKTRMGSNITKVNYEPNSIASCQGNIFWHNKMHAMFKMP